jgi:hypothetical protein
MNRKNFISFIILLCSVFAFSQEPIYFNNIYNPVNTYASGRGILQVDNFYYGIFGTWEPPDYWYKLAIFKMDMSGNLIDWNLVGEDYHEYYAGSVGGTLIRTNDGNFAFTCQVEDANTGYGTLVKLNLDLDTLWKKDYYTENDLTLTIKVKQTPDGGYIIVGQVKPEQGTYYNALLLRTDSFGNELWHQDYGGNWAEQGTDVIQTPDGGYLIGGYFWKPGYDHSLDAMVIKTDSLGNEEWTQYYGNPDVDDDMALVAMADDGNYLVATVYGEWIIAPEARTGRMYIVKVDQEGNTVWDIKIGPKMYASYVKNLRYTQDGNLIASGFFMDDTTSDYIYKGFLYKFTQEGDSIWMRDYNHFNNQYDRNFFYDAYPTSDNGYIAIGKALPDMGGNNKMWIVKVDSMGCDTPGCNTGVNMFEWIAEEKGELKVWPNPTKSKFEVWSLEFEVAGNKIIRVYNSQGLKVEEIKIPKGIESMEVDVSKYTNGLYYLQYIHANKILETVKFIKN